MQNKIVEHLLSETAENPACSTDISNLSPPLLSCGCESGVQPVMAVNTNGDKGKYCPPATPCGSIVRKNGIWNVRLTADPCMCLNGEPTKIVVKDRIGYYCRTPESPAAQQCTTDNSGTDGPCTCPTDKNIMQAGKGKYYCQ